MKDIKDYLHLYLGCGAIVEKSDYHMVHNWAVHAGDNITIDGLVIFHINNVLELKAIIKPILRPLSDMTDEDQKFFGCDDEYFEHMKTMTHQIIHLHTDEFHYLLKQHFDLFGLIESGLAISKVKEEIKK